MKKLSIFCTALALCALPSYAQLGKLLGKKGTETEKSTDLPKGIEIYSQTHTDSTGVSGKYYMKYPLKLVTKNMMNMEKPFYVNEVTVEIRKNLTGVFHFVNDEPKNQIRYTSTDMNTVVDLGSGAMNTEVAKRSMQKCNCINLQIRNAFEPKTTGNGFKDGAVFIRYSKDPDIVIIGSPNYSEYKKNGKKGYFTENKFEFLGAHLNVLCKDKAKLEQWDSTKIADALFEEMGFFHGKVTSAFGELVEMPRQMINDDAREKEYFDLAKPMAAIDKPVSWGNQLVYVYINKDWEVKYEDALKTKPKFRFCKVICVSTGWPNNECRYIPCTIKQNWDGKDFGKSYFAGFEGALVPVSCDKVSAFSH